MQSLQSAIAKRANEIASESAERWGGRRSEYLSGAFKQARAELTDGAQRIEEEWREQDVKSKPQTKKRTVKRRVPKQVVEEGWREASESEIPIWDYYGWLQGTVVVESLNSPASAYYKNSDAFWLNNAGIGRADYDGLDPAAWRSWVDTSDFSVMDVIGFFEDRMRRDYGLYFRDGWYVKTTTTRTEYEEIVEEEEYEVPGTPYKAGSPKVSYESYSSGSRPGTRKEWRYGELVQVTDTTETYTIDQLNRIMARRHGRK